MPKKTVKKNKKLIDVTAELHYDLTREVGQHEIEINKLNQRIDCLIDAHERCKSLRRI